MEILAREREARIRLPGAALKGREAEAPARLSRKILHLEQFGFPARLECGFSSASLALRSLLVSPGSLDRRNFKTGA